MRGDDLVLLRWNTSGTPAFAQVEDQRTTGLSINGETIDITSKDSLNWRELLAGGGIKSMSLSVEGVWTSSVNQEGIRDDAMDGSLTDYQIDDGVEATEGAFQVTSFELSGAHDGEQTYSATLESAEVPTVT